MNKIYSTLLTFFCVFLSISLNTLSAKAEDVCKVTDPTGTPLNVRNQPNGRVINQLRNGREVYILDVANDEQGRPWARIAGYYNSQYRVWGWVLREFVSCYKR